MDWPDQVAQPNHPHSHSSEARSSGWIMVTISMLGEIIKLRLLTLEFHINQQLKLKDQHSTVLLVQMVQLNHLHNLSSEVRNNGWIMDRILMTGELIRWKSPMLESHMPLLFRLKLK